MHVNFLNTKYMTINRTNALPIGTVICDLMNMKRDNWRFLVADTYGTMKSIQPDKLSDIPAMDGPMYDTILFRNAKKFEGYRAYFARHPFYQYSDEPGIAFDALEGWIDNVRKQLRTAPDSIPLLDLNIELNHIEPVCRPLKQLLQSQIVALTLFEPLVGACLIYDKHSDITPTEKLKAYDLAAFNDKVRMLVLKAGFSVEYIIQTDEQGNDTLAETYNITSLAQYLYLETMRMIQQGYYLHKCRNCGEYFIINGNRALEYCDNVAPGEKKPCSTIGPARILQRKIASDPIAHAYTRAYKKYIARRRKGVVSEEFVKDWATRAREYRQEAYDGKISLMELIEKLD